MHILDKYLYHVRRYLPLLDRDKLINQLKEDISSEIDIENEELVVDYLKKLGHPREAARKLRGDRGLFSTELSPLLDLVLSFVSILLPLLLLLLRLLEFVSTNEGYELLELILYVVYYIPTIIILLLAAIGFIFLSFVLIERYIQPRFNLDTYKFDPRKLPPVATEGYQTPLLFTLAGLMICIGLLYLINLEQGLIALYSEGETIPLLNQNFNQILFLIDISLLIVVGIYIFHIFKRRKTFLSRLLGFFSSYFFSIILLLFAFSNVFNQEFINTFNISFLPILIKIVFSLVALGITIKTTIEIYHLFKEKSQIN